ncbi:MAG: periplasmic heavy metal sensor, partial [Roseobacter sp.]
MSGDDAQPVRRNSKWLGIALAISLAVNLLIVGFMAGSFARHTGSAVSGARAPGLGNFGAPYMMALPRQERRAVLRALRAEAKGRVPDRQARRALFDEVLSVLRATPFDRNALQQAVSQQAETSIYVQQTAQAAWL